MENLSGCLKAKLADENEQYEIDLVKEINDQIKPPRPVCPENVHIRAMYIVSDQINSQGGCFPEGELDRLVELLVDSPVMVGHKRDSLPLARNFKAQKVVIDGRTWVKSYFYWMRNGKGAEDLQNNIDGGIYKECSVSFLFRFPECSICGKDIRQCHHIPFREYELGPDRREIAHFKYRNIERVLETSLVFRGAIPHTRITDKLSPEKVKDAIFGRSITATHFFKISNGLTAESPVQGYGKAAISFCNAGRFCPKESVRTLYPSPYQPGIILRIGKKNEKFEFETALRLSDEVRKHLSKILSDIKAESFVIDALLYVVKGKSRLNGVNLLQIIDSGSNLYRLRMKICDASELNGAACNPMSYKERMAALKSVFGDTARRGIEIRRMIPCTRGDWNAETAAEECSQYNFGLEVVTEDASGILARYILSEEELLPAVIDKTMVLNRTHIRCNLKLIGSGQTITEVVSPTLPGIEKNAVALLSPSKTPGGKRTRWALIDILAGVDKTAIDCEMAAFASDAPIMMVDDNNGGLKLTYREGEREWTAVIYNFSPKLFGMGRRFIADVKPDQDQIFKRPDSRSIRLDSVTRSGKLILIRLKEPAPAFGNISGLWLRPVLINGAERYLFYADGIIHHPEVL